jgi:hypothetical protein
VNFRYAQSGLKIHYGKVKSECIKNRLVSKRALAQRVSIDKFKIFETLGYGIVLKMESCVLLSNFLFYKTRMKLAKIGSRNFGTKFGSRKQPVWLRLEPC